MDARDRSKSIFDILDRLAEHIRANGWDATRIRSDITFIRVELLLPFRYVGYTDRLHIVNVDMTGMLAQTLKAVVDIPFPDLVVRCSRLTGAYRRVMK